MEFAVSCSRAFLILFNSLILVLARRVRALEQNPCQRVPMSATEPRPC